MNKKYIKPSIVVEETLLNAVMETVSVKGDIDDGNKGDFVVNGKECYWGDDEE